MSTSVGSVKLDTSVLDGIMRDLGVNKDKAVAAVASQVEDTAKPLAPVGITGNLMDGIHVEKKEDGVYWVSDSVEYGIYQELGTYKMAAHPFMVPACEQVGRYIDDQWGALF